MGEFAIPTVWRQDKADRKDVYDLIKRLPVHERLEWIRWCCKQVRHLGNHETLHISDGGVTEVFTDWQNLCGQYGVSESQTVEDLERRVKHCGVPLSFTAGGVLLGAKG